MVCPVVDTRRYSATRLALIISASLSTRSSLPDVGGSAYQIKCFCMRAYLVLTVQRLQGFAVCKCQRVLVCRIDLALMVSRTSVRNRRKSGDAHGIELHVEELCPSNFAALFS